MLNHQVPIYDCDAAQDVSLRSEDEKLNARLKHLTLVNECLVVQWEQVNLKVFLLNGTSGHDASHRQVSWVILTFAGGRTDCEWRGSSDNVEK